MAHVHESRTNFASESDHAIQLAARTHPLSAERLRTFADALQESAGGYSSNGLTRLEIVTIAAQLHIVARNFLDIQRLTALVSQTIRPQDLGPMRPGERLGRFCHENVAVSGSFSGLFRGSIIVNGVEFDLDVEMARSGDNVRGRSSYGIGVSEFEGVLEGDTLHYRWWQGSNVGRGTLKRKASGYEGTWGNGDSATDGGTSRLNAN